MAREKVDYRDNLELILERFGKVMLIPIKKASQHCGVDERSLKKDSTFPLKRVAGRYYVPAVGLARWMSTNQQ